MLDALIAYILGREVGIVYPKWKVSTERREEVKIFPKPEDFVFFE